jgi:hypothetical protein
MAAKAHLVILFDYTARVDATQNVCCFSALAL